jgi:hypothetical protein
VVIAVSLFGVEWLDLMWLDECCKGQTEVKIDYFCNKVDGFGVTLWRFQQRTLCRDFSFHYVVLLSD